MSANLLKICVYLPEEQLNITCKKVNKDYQRGRRWTPHLQTDNLLITTDKQYILHLSWQNLRKHLSIKLFLQIAEVFTNHQLAQTLACDQEPSDSVRPVVKEPVLNEVTNAFLWLSVLTITINGNNNVTLPFYHVLRCKCLSKSIFQSI